MAYKLSSGGSDWVYIKVLSVDQETGETADLEDKLEYVKFSSLAWTHDHKVGTHVPSIVTLLKQLLCQSDYCCMHFQSHRH